jgi:hypothetical protein
LSARLFAKRNRRCSCRRVRASGVRHDNLANLARTANDGESKIQRVSDFQVDRLSARWTLRLNNFRYLSSLFAQRARRGWTIELEILLRVVVGDLLLGLLRKVRMIPQVLEALGKLTVPVRDVRGIEEVIVEKLLAAR